MKTAKKSLKEQKLLVKFAKKVKYKNKGVYPRKKKYSIPIFSIQGADSIPKPVPSIPIF